MSKKVSEYNHLSEKEKLKILTVKAVEENSNNTFNQLTISKANILAISANSDREFILKRAEYLFSLLPETLQATTQVPAYKSKILKAVFFISLIIGIFSNYLGTSNFIHIIYNPLTILLGWNILVYIFFLLTHFLNFKPKPAFTEESSKANAPSGEPTTTETSPAQETVKKPNFIIRWISGWLFKRAVILKSGYEDKKTKVVLVKNILTPLWHDYLKIAGTSLIYRFKVSLQVGAMGLATGALIGVYFRGLFFKYNMVWQSTFISDLNTIKHLLNILFGPASYLLYGKLIDIEQIKGLIQPGGVNAAPWIHMMAVTTILYVIIPRLLLAWYYTFKEKRSLKEIDFDIPYYKDHILKNRTSILEAVKNGISEIITKRINLISLKISDFVVQDYFDKIIIPILINYREKGGKIKDLENKLYQSQKNFEPILINYLTEIEEEFQETVLAEINLFLGRNFAFEINTSSTYQPQSDELDKHLSDKLASNISDTLSGTFVTTMALTVGSLTGGIGKSLGTAIISTLFGVSGPVGLLIGGMVTAITLGGVYIMNKGKITQQVKEIPIPSFAIAMSLSDKKIAKAREETREHTQKEIINTLKPKIDEVTNNILKEIIN